ncbi:MAG: hypothetical protein JXJ20_04810 [Anaerolineae bacterium]|nr:hypothetical protein [Anaerolineae bacterium]
MGWRLHLSDQPIQAVQLLGGDPRQIAVWPSAHEVCFYAESNGALYTCLRVSPPIASSFNSETWRAFVETLRAPNGVYLPVVDTGSLVIHTSKDGRLRLYQGYDGRLTLDMDGHQTRLEHRTDTPLAAVALDRELGTIGALGTDGVLHIYQQHMAIGAYPVAEDGDLTAPVLLLPDVADQIVVADAARIQALDLNGQLQHTLPASSTVGAVACSPDGSWIIAADRDTGMIRLYDAQLTLLRQRAARDLLAEAEPVQLFAALPAPGMAPGALDVADDGTLLFSLGGMLCLTHVNELTKLPRPRALF